nr:hypothetical protein CFP56_21743 [Quercus suber]
MDQESWPTACAVPGGACRVASLEHIRFRASVPVSISIVSCNHEADQRDLISDRQRDKSKSHMLCRLMFQLIRIPVDMKKPMILDRALIGSIGPLQCY